MIMFFVFLSIIIGYILVISPFLGLFFLLLLCLMCLRKIVNKTYLFLFLFIVAVSMLFAAYPADTATVDYIDELKIVDYKYYRDEIHYVAENGGLTFDLFVEEGGRVEIGTVCTGGFTVADINEQRNFLKRSDYMQLTVNQISGRIYENTLEGKNCQTGEMTVKMTIANLRYMYIVKLLNYTSSDYKFDLLTLSIGNKSYIESDFFDSLQKLGIYHLYVISGTHVAFIGAFLYFAFRKMRLTLRTIKILLIISLLLFLLINVFSPSVFRAVFMAVLLIVTSFFNKKPYMTIISLSAIIQILFNPYIVFHAGYQLSYITTYFILLARPFIHGQKAFIQLLQITLISEVSTLLVILIQFNEISISGIIMNLFFVPLFSIIIFPMVILFQAVMIMPKINMIDNFYHIIFTSLQEMISYLSHFIKHRYAVKNLPEPVYILIALMTFLIARNICRLDYIKVIVFSLGLMVTVYVSNVTDRDDFTFTMIDVGQGDSFLIEDHKNDQTVMIDTGGVFTFDDRESMLAEKTVLPYLKERGIDNIDLLILSHMDIDHVGEAKDVINNKNVRNLMVNMDDPKFNEWSKNILEDDFEGDVLSSKDIETLAVGNIMIENLVVGRQIISEDSNEHSIVLKIVLGEYKFLMTGDMTLAMEEFLVQQGNDIGVDVLKLAHHGSNTSTGNVIVEAAGASYALISAGAENQYGHPHQEVLDRLEGVNILSTKDAGMVQLNIKSDKLCVRTKLEDALNHCKKKS